MAVILVNLKDTFNQWRKKTNDISLGVGDFRYIESGDRTLVRSTNRNFRNIGELNSLSTDQKGNIVDAVNEVDLNTDTNTVNIGNIILLDTNDKSSVVNAVNEVYGDVGDVGSLSTDSKSSVVVAVNEVDSHTDTNTYSIGVMSNLTSIQSSPQRDNIVSVIGDVEGNLNLVWSDIGSIEVNIDNIESDVLWLENRVGTVTLNTTAQDVSSAVNELVASNSFIGDLTDLTTDDNGTIVGAINEINAITSTTQASIGDMATLDTANQLNLVSAINELAGNSIAFALVLG